MDKIGIKSTGESLRQGSFSPFDRSGSCNVFIQDLESGIQLDLNSVKLSNSYCMCLTDRGGRTWERRALPRPLCWLADVISKVGPT